MCRSVQEERPRSSTSGGQSAGGPWKGIGVVLEDLSWVFARARQEEKEVQLRHLYISLDAVVRKFD